MVSIEILTLHQIQLLTRDWVSLNWGRWIWNQRWRWKLAVKIHLLQLKIKKRNYHVQLWDFFWRPFVFRKHFCSSNPKNTCDTSFSSWNIRLSLEETLDIIITPYGTQITPQNKNVVFLKGFPHGTHIFKLVHCYYLAKIYIFGAQSWVSQLSNDVSSF